MRSVRRSVILRAFICGGALGLALAANSHAQFGGGPGGANFGHGFGGPGFGNGNGFGNGMNRPNLGGGMGNQFGNGGGPGQFGNRNMGGISRGAGVTTAPAGMFMTSRLIKRHAGPRGSWQEESSFGTNFGGGNNFNGGFGQGNQGFGGGRGFNNGGFAGRGGFRSLPNTLKPPIHRRPSGRS